MLQEEAGLKDVCFFQPDTEVPGKMFSRVK